MKQKYSIRQFKKRAKKVVFAHQFIDLERASRVGLIVNMNQYTTKELIVLTDYITKLEDLGKQVVLIEINLTRKSQPMFVETIKSIFLNPSSINWLGFPSISKMLEINKTRCEILINLDTSGKLTSRFICGLSNASTRAGIEKPGQEVFYELILQLPEEIKLRPMLAQFDHYLKEIEK